MKILTVAMLMVAAGAVQAGESEKCSSAVETAAHFMASTYGANFSDVQVQVVSVKKGLKEPTFIADVLTSAGVHKCALKYIPALPRRGTTNVCLWSLQAVSCDSPDVMKRTITDEQSWVDSKATREAWRRGMNQDIKLTDEKKWVDDKDKAPVLRRSPPTTPDEDDKGPAK